MKRVKTNLSLKAQDWSNSATFGGEFMLFVANVCSLWQIYKFMLFVANLCIFWQTCVVCRKFV